MLAHRQLSKVPPPQPPEPPQPPPLPHPRDLRSSSYAVICSPVTSGLMGLFVHELTRKTIIPHMSLWSDQRI